MSLTSKTFYISQASSLSSISNYFQAVIGNDAYLIKDMQVSLLNPNTVSITVFYETFPDSLIATISPNIGDILGTGTRSSSFGLDVLFNKPINTSNISNNSITIDGNTIPSGDILLTNNCNNYQLQIRLSGSSLQQSGIHSYYFKTGFQFLDGSYLEDIYPGGYAFHTPCGPSNGEPYTVRKRGLIEVSVVTSPKTTTSQEAIAIFLNSKRLEYENLISYGSVDTGNNISTYFLYISSPEPQVVESFPRTNSLYPATIVPSSVFINFNTKLGTNYTGYFSIQSGYNKSSDIPSSNITLLEDKKSVKLDLSGYIPGAGLYSILIKPGITNYLGNIKSKPDQINIQISDLIGGSVFSNVSTGVATHGQLSGLLEDDHPQYLTTGRAETWLQTSPTFTGHGHFIASTGVPDYTYQRPGVIWLETNSVKFFLWYVDEDSAQWVQIL